MNVYITRRARRRNVYITGKYLTATY